MSIVIVLNCEMLFFAEKKVSQYEVTDQYVAIDYTKYAIAKDGTVKYDGQHYKVEDGCLISNDNGILTVFILPIEQNKVTDKKLLKQLNESIGKELQGGSKSVPSNPVNLPCIRSVQQGQYDVISPAFNNINGTFYYYTNLKMTKFKPANADKRFLIQFYMCDSQGTWYHKNVNHNFGTTNYVRCTNLSIYRYGRFFMTNLYASPSPAYTYTIYHSNA